MPSDQKKIVFIADPMLHRHQERFPDSFERYSILAAFAIRTLAQRLNGYANDWLAPLGLNASKYNYLAALYFSPGQRSTPNEISKLINTSNAAVTIMFGALIAEGLVAKSPNPADRRSFLVRLTGKGARAVEQAVPIHCLSIKKGFGKMSAKERKELVRLISLVQTGFEEWFEPGRRGKGR